jgi:hypothetical protein
MAGDFVPYYLNHETILDDLCPAQVRVCEEFTRSTSKDAFERVVKLVNDIADAGRCNNRDTLEQAVYKIALLAQGMKKGAAEFPRAQLRCIVAASPPHTNNRVTITAMPAHDKVFFYKRKRTKKVVPAEHLQEAAD